MLVLYLPSVAPNTSGDGAAIDADVGVRANSDASQSDGFRNVGIARLADLPAALLSTGTALIFACDCDADKASESKREERKFELHVCVGRSLNCGCVQLLND
jgi:hypothetical protein